MKNVLFLFIVIFMAHGLQAQILEPAKWSYDISKQEVNIGDEVELVFKVRIDKDWYVYSSDFDPDLGPMLTEFTFEPNLGYELVGKITPVNPKKKYDPIWEGEVTYFSGVGEFRQKVKITESNPTIKGSYSYQVCSDVDGKCINFEDEFTFDNFHSAIASGNNSNSVPLIETKPLQLSATDTPIKEEKKASISMNPQKEEVGLLKSRDVDSPYSLLSFMIIAFLAGLAALLTPCVFPMIPMTVSFFTAKTKNKKQGIRKALIYGLSIIFIYTLIGSIVAPFMGAGVANELATHWLPNVLFFLVFVIFALSFFGLFEITLPSSWINKADEKADKGGFAGIFFMAFTLVMVSFSCTGPIVGSILVEAAGGQVLKPILGMFAFSMAFAVPFTLFAIFPEWMNSLPKSGGWLNSVKVVLGFLELAFALKFLSIADQAYHWGILDREIYLAFWIVIFTLLGFYLLGKIRLPNDSATETISVPKLVLAIITFTFVIYLFPGMFGAPLKALAGYLPPMYTHDFNLNQARHGNPVLSEKDNENLCSPPKYADFLHFPHGIQGYFDYDEALACAKDQQKPVFIDFTGHGCVNCREMEVKVWSDPQVLKRLNSDFIMLALYVDDKTDLPESQWYTSDYDKKVKKSIGKQNADLQIWKFNNNAQPFYIIVDPDGKLLVEPKSYDLSIENFISFLDAGKEAFSLTREGL